MQYNDAPPIQERWSQRASASAHGEHPETLQDQVGNLQMRERERFFETGASPAGQ